MGPLGPRAGVGRRGVSGSAIADRRRPRGVPRRWGATSVWRTPADDGIGNAEYGGIARDAFPVIRSAGLRAEEKPALTLVPERIQDSSRVPRLLAVRSLDSLESVCHDAHEAGLPFLEDAF